MKKAVEKRSPQGIIDHLALGLTTFGVGYLPGAPGTYGSAAAIAIYFGVSWIETGIGLGLDPAYANVFYWVLNAILLIGFSLAGIWASTRSIPFLGNEDASEAVVDEVIGQFITLSFVPFGLPWPFILAGFLLFRLFDIWKPYPIRDLEMLPGGLGICGDDMVAGVYAGICLAIGYSVYLAI